MNALVFGLTVYAAGWLLSQFFERAHVYALVGRTCVLASPALFGVSVMAYSEPLFGLLVLLFLPSLAAWLQNRKRLSFVVLIFSVALACMTRCAGIALILAGSLALLFVDRGRLKA